MAYDFSQFSGSDGSGGLGSHVLEFLSYFDRPRNALATGVSNLIDNDPETGFWWGAKEGLMGDRDTSWGDVVGIPKGTEEDSWLPWLGKQGTRLALDVALDPLNVLFAPAKAAGVFPRLAKGLGVPEGRSIAGLAGKAAHLDEVSDVIGAKSGLTRAFGRSSGNEAIDKWAQSQRYGSQRLQREYNNEMMGIARRINEMGVDTETLYQALDHPEQAAALGVPQEALDLFRSAASKLEGAFDTGNQLRGLHGLDPVEKITQDPEKLGAGFTPRVRRQFGTFDDAGGGVALDPSMPKGRTIRKLVGDDGEEIITRMDKQTLAKLGITKDKAGGYFREGPTPHDRIDYQVVEASAPEIWNANINLGKERWVSDPEKAYALAFGKQTRRNDFLELLQKGKEEGVLDEAGKVPEGYQHLRIPSLEHYAVGAGEGLTEGKGIGNWWDNLVRESRNEKMRAFLENKAKLMFDPNTPMGKIGELIEGFADSRIGRGVKGLTAPWKYWTLGTPGWLAGNIGSNELLKLSEGQWNLPARWWQAGKAQLGKGDDIFEGMTNPALREEMLNREILGTKGIYGEDGTDYLSEAVKQPSFWERRLPRLTKAATWAPEQIFKVGGAAEDNARVGMAIDWLKKNAPDIGRRSPEEQAALLDEAATFAHRAMVDYRPSSMTPTENASKALVPFYGWQGGILRNTGRLATEHPEQLANVGRVLDAALTPLSPEDKRITDPWVQEAAPIESILGMPISTILEALGGEPEGKSFMTAGRFIPQTNVAQMFSRPTEALLGSITPYIKTPLEGITGYNSFKGGPIDRLASGPLGGYTAPLTGAPYEMAPDKFFGQDIPAAYAHLGQLNPLQRVLGQVEQAGRISGLDLWEDPYKKPLTAAEAGAWYGTGGKVYPFDRSRYLARRQWEFGQKEKTLRSDLRNAQKKGDFERASFYQEQLNEHMRNKARNIGLAD